MIISEEAYLSHHGVKGMKWGVRRDPKTGVRPIAKTLSESKLGDISRSNVKRHNARVAARNSRQNAEAMSAGRRFLFTALGAGLMAVGIAQLSAARRYQLATR